MSCTSSSSLPSNHWQSSEQTKEKFKFYLSLLSEHNTSSYSCKSRRADDYCSCSIIPKWNIVMIKCHFYSWTNIFFLWYVCICQCQQQHWVWSFSYFLYITRSGCWMSSWSLLYIVSPWCDIILFQKYLFISNKKIYFFNWYFKNAFSISLWIKPFKRY